MFEPRFIAKFGNAGAFSDADVALKRRRGCAAPALASKRIFTTLRYSGSCHHASIEAPPPVWYRAGLRRRLRRAVEGPPGDGSGPRRRRSPLCVAAQE